MKKYVLVSVLFAALLSCNNDTKTNDAPDTTKTNAAATDSTQIPNGVTTGSAISTDTAATRLDTTQHK